jgi:hypothetical protein
LEFLLTEGEKGFLFVTSLEACFSDCGFAVCNYGDALLVLVDIVALVLQAEDCPEYQLARFKKPAKRQIDLSLSDILCELGVFPIAT